MTDHDKLRELAQAATPGPWITAPELSAHGGMYFGTAAANASKTDLLLGNTAYIRDADFIVAANPRAIIALLDELRDAQSLITYLQETR